MEIMNNVPLLLQKNESIEKEEKYLFSEIKYK